MTRPPAQRASKSDLLRGQSAESGRGRWFANGRKLVRHLAPEGQREEFLVWRRGQVLAELPESILDEFGRREADEWRTTLGELARLFRVDLELMRQALERLKGERCVSLSPDPAGVGYGDDLTLAWVLDPYDYDFDRSGDAETRTPNPPPLRLLHP